MHYFEKYDPKKLQKQYFKHMWEVEEETRHHENKYLNTEAEEWENQIKQKATQVYENDQQNAPDWIKQYYQEQIQTNTVPTLFQQGVQQQQKEEKQNQSLTFVQEQRILANMPEEAPQWMQPYHLEFYGKFVGKWQKYMYQQNDGQKIPYWFSKDLNKSTWDSPILILEVLLQNGVESDMHNNVLEWEGIGGTNFLKVKLEDRAKKKTKNRYLYIHRYNKQLFRSNPLEQKKEVKDKGQENEGNEVQSDDGLNIEIEGEDEEQKDEEENDEEIDEQLLDPNAFDSDEDEEIVQRQYDESSSSQEEQKQEQITQLKSNQYDSDSSEQSFELSPQQQFFYDNQRQINQFKQMLQDKKISLINTTYERELPKIIHDPRFRIIPQQYRELIYDEYVQNQDLEKQRKLMWQKNKELKLKFVDECENLIKNNQIDGDMEFYQFQNVFEQDEQRKTIFKKIISEDKEFVKQEFTKITKELKEKKRDQVIDDYKNMLKQKLDAKNLNENTDWKDIKQLIQNESQYKNLKSITLRQNLFEEYLMSEILKTPGQKRDRLIFKNENQDEILALDKKEKKRQKKEEQSAIDNYKALLEEKIKMPNVSYQVKYFQISFKDASQNLKEDPRYSHQSLTFDQKLEMYREFMKNLYNQKRKDFRDMLDENKALVNPFSTWDNIKEMIKDDPRFSSFPEKNHRQTFDQHKEFLTKKIKLDFINLMQEMNTRLLISKYCTHPYKQIKDELIEILEDRLDKFKTMGLYFQEERDQILQEEFEKLKP